MKFLFGDIVVIEKDLIGVVVKTWNNINSGDEPYEYEIYVRNYNAIKTYKQSQIKRYGVRHKELNEEEIRFQSAYARSDEE